MAEIIWTEPALTDLDAIADYIALDNPDAAQTLIGKVFAQVERLAGYPESGSKPIELRGWRYRQIIEPPCRIFYRHEAGKVYILHVIRSEQKLRATALRNRSSSR